MTAKAGPKFHLGHEELIALYKQMLRIRHFEEKCAELYQAEKIRGFLHLAIGEEAIAAAVMRVLRPDDAIVATYREHGHALARGIPMRNIMAEMFGKASGCSGGRGGSMHLYDKSTRFYGGNAIVGGGLPIAVGAALADKMQGRDSVAVCFFGEGAVAEGEFHESLNLAALWKLPVLFICENNLYAMGTRLDLSESQTDIHIKAQSYNMPAEAIDGMDVVALAAAANRAVATIRGEGGPYFLECRTYRFRAHSMFDPQLYRDKAEIESWKAKGPLLRFRNWLLDAHLVHDEELKALEREIDAEIEDAVRFAEEAPWEPVETLTDHVYETPPQPHVAPAPPRAPARKLTYRDAAREGLRTALASDPRVFMMGEDVGHYGGCYAVSKGLLEEFGPERMRDTPLSESGFVGAGLFVAGTTGFCGMARILALMPWNKRTYAPAK